MVVTVTGIYRQGRIELLDKPDGIREGRVLVTLAEDNGASAGVRYLVRGKYKTGRMSTEEDFRIAEWNGEEEFDAH